MLCACCLDCASTALGFLHALSCFHKFYRKPHKILCKCRYGLTWEAQADKPGLGSYYLDLGDKLNAICPSCILLLEGTGQSKFLGVDWCAPCPAIYLWYKIYAANLWKP